MRRVPVPVLEDVYTNACQILFCVLGAVRLILACEWLVTFEVLILK
jgi:hypothetical protein